MTRLLLSDSSWFCGRCSVEQNYAPTIYGVPLCPRCVMIRADESGQAYFHQARVYALERELAQAERNLGVMRRVRWQQVMTWRKGGKRRRAGYGRLLRGSHRGL